MIHKGPSVVLVMIALSGCSAPRHIQYARIIDLTHPFDENTVYWPNSNTFQLTEDAEGVTSKGYYYAANSFCAAEHGGTHIDAPVHFFEDRQTVDGIPLTRLIGSGVVVDVSEQCGADRDYQVQVEDFEECERRLKLRFDDVIVLLRTGYGFYYPDRASYMGTADRGEPALAKLHFPGLHPDAARWLTQERSIKAIGLDTPSIDFGQSQLFQSHVELFKYNVPVFENLANLDQLPEHGFDVIALPIKIRNGSGGPLRIIALLD